MSKQTVTFDPLRRGRTNRDRRDQASARSVIAIAEAKRRVEQGACCDGNDPACATHGVAASNARQNEFLRNLR